MVEKERGEMEKMKNDQLMLSVIVPIYNVEEFLLECMESINESIKNINAEVLLVDDGSPDGSAEIAKEYVKDHPKFKYFRKENGGLADTRNYGISQSEGKYLAFVDSDDLVSEDMFEKMIASAEMHDTDLTITNVARFNSRRVFNASLYIRMFNDVDETVTHIKECDRLIFDTIVCNKIVRRDFWIENNFEFPVGFRFEDMAVSLAMHCQARRISIVKTVGYLWRVREGESKSITQENTKTVNLEHRLFMLNRMYDYIENEMGGDERLKSLLDGKVLSLDLIIYLNAMADMPKKGQEKFREIIAEFFYKHFNDKSIETLSALNRQKYIDVLERRYNEIFPLRRYGRRSYRTAPIVRTADGDKLKLDSELFDQDYYEAKYEFSDSIPLHAIDDVEYADGKLYIKMDSYFHRVNMAEGEQRIKATLQNIVTGSETNLPVSMIDGHHVSLRYGKVFDELTGEIQNYNYDGSAYQIEIDPQSIGNNKDLFGDNLIIVRYSNAIKDGSFFVRTTDSNVILKNRLIGSSICDDATSVYFDHDAQSALILNVSKKGMHDSDKIQELPRTHAWLADLKKNEDNSIDITIELGDEAADFKKGRIDLCFTDKLAGKNIKLDSAELMEDGGDANLCYSIKFDNQDLLNNLYKMQTEIVIQNEELKTIPVYAEREKRTSVTVEPLKLTLLSNNDDYLSLMVERLDILTKNHGHYNRRLLYPEYRKEEIDNKTIVFESYWGTQYSCNPRALYEYIDKNHPEYTCVWSLVDDRIPIKGKGIRVRKGSAEYYRYLATSKYFVNNVNFEKGYRKRSGQIEIQTMHGTPLKTLGLDVTDEFRTEEERIAYVKRNRRWNYLIAQGRFTEEKASDWYGFNKRVLCTGYPRTDELFNVKEEECKRIKEDLELPDNKKIILYAPTFRKKGEYEMPIDLELMRENLSDEYILLIRLHHFVYAAYKVPEDGKFIFDAGKYDNITDLYKIADIMITDYSSVMFDFALTGNPMIFFTYDLDEYVNQTRGVYFDIRTEGPGPIVKTNEELLEALKAGGKGNEDRVKLFRDKYLTYECANSSELIYNEVFTGKERSAKNEIKQAAIKLFKALVPKDKYRKIREKWIKRSIK